MICVTRYFCHRNHKDWIFPQMEGWIFWPNILVPPPCPLNQMNWPQKCFSLFIPAPGRLFQGISCPYIPLSIFLLSTGGHLFPPHSVVTSVFFGCGHRRVGGRDRGQTIKHICIHKPPPSIPAHLPSDNFSTISPDGYYATVVKMLFCLHIFVTPHLAASQTFTSPFFPQGMPL